MSDPHVQVKVHVGVLAVVLVVEVFGVHQVDLGLKILCMFKVTPILQMDPLS